jgi:hypothetical protein
MSSCLDASEPRRVPYRDMAGHGRDHGAPASSWWGSSSPPSNVTNTVTTWVGSFIVPTADIWLLGFRGWCPSTSSNPWTACIWNPTDASWTDPTIAFYNGFPNPVAPSLAWLQAWIHPKRKLLSGTGYMMACTYHSTYSRHASQLTSPVTVGHLTFHNGWQSTAVWPPATSPTLNTNANAVDILYELA